MTGRPLRFKSGATIGFQARPLLMIVLLSAVRLVTAPFRSAISFGNAGVQLGVGGMTKVLNWVSKVTSVGTTFLKGLH